MTSSLPRMTEPTLATTSLARRASSWSSSCSTPATTGDSASMGPPRSADWACPSIVPMPARSATAPAERHPSATRWTLPDRSCRLVVDGGTLGDGDDRPDRASTASWVWQFRPDLAEYGRSANMNANVITHRGASVIRTQIQLTESQAREVKRWAEERGVSMAAIIREAVDAHLRDRNAPSWDEIVERAIAAVGMLRVRPRRRRGPARRVLRGVSARLGGGVRVYRRHVRTRHASRAGMTRATQRGRRSVARRSSQRPDVLSTKLRVSSRRLAAVQRRLGTTGLCVVFRRHTCPPGGRVGSTERTTTAGSRPVHGANRRRRLIVGRLRQLRGDA